MSQFEQLQSEPVAESHDSAARILSPELKKQFETLRNLLQRALWLAERSADIEATQILRTRLTNLQSAALLVIVGEVKAGKITLTAKNAYREGANLKYVFEIRAVGSNEHETSAPLAAGAKETSWVPNLQIKAGEKYAWRVKIMDGQWSGPAASSEFVGIK